MSDEKDSGPPETLASTGGPRRLAAHGAPLLAATLASATVLSWAIGCGANMQAVYEGDMQFEHCMALDADTEVTPTIQRACWTEWLAFYTYGQTRDRVRYAESRIQALEHADLVPIEEVAKAAPEPLAAPSPASMVSAPPIVEAAGADAGSTSPGTGRALPERQPCLQRCVAIRSECRSQCTNRECERGCSAGFAGCAERCPP